MHSRRPGARRRDHMAIKSTSLQNGHANRFKAVSDGSPSHKRGLEPRRDAPRRCDQSPFVVRVRSTSTSRTKTHTFAHISRHPCLPENLHDFPHKCWLATHLQKSVSRAQSMQRNRTYASPRGPHYRDVFRTRRTTLPSIYHSPHGTCPMLLWLMRQTEITLMHAQMVRLTVVHTLVHPTLYAPQLTSSTCHPTQLDATPQVHDRALKVTFQLIDACVAPATTIDCLEPR